MSALLVLFVAFLAVLFVWGVASMVVGAVRERRRRKVTQPYVERETHLW